MSVILHPDVPGRGAWTRTGGLLPLKPGGDGPGYYRPAHLGERMVGAVYAFGADTSYTAQVVHLGVKVVQRLVGADPDGWLGDDTGKAIASAQKRLKLTVDAVAGPATLRALLTPYINDTAAEHGVPVDVLGGVCVYESGLDVAAVGVSGWDHGIAQINLAAHNLSIPQALDPRTALTFTAVGLSEVHDRWAGHTKADPWDIAVASHNSPQSAEAWAKDKDGKPPFSQSRKDHGFPQISEYVQHARTAWTEQA